MKLCDTPNALCGSFAFEGDFKVSPIKSFTVVLFVSFCSAILMDRCCQCSSLPNSLGS